MPHPPSVDTLARQLAAETGLPHPLCVDVARAAIADGSDASAGASALAATLLQPVVNATGVLLHTNLGRAPLDVEVGGRASNLELDLATGSRGSRNGTGRPGDLLARLCGAEAALVVNNGAAAVLLVLAALAAGREVVVSRGELVEIGGGFRIPEVLAASGARLVEVGTTNKTRVSDYTWAAAAGAALVLKVHPSNYRIEGFTSAVATDELSAALPGQGSPPIVADLGSGLLDAACPWVKGGPPAWLAGEPAARQTLDAGAALVTFSGDKLLGGPQAGIIAGRRELVERCAAHPLARALRPGSLVLAALHEVALSYLRRDVCERIPFWRMATASLASVRERADAVAAAVPGADVLDTRAVPGAGSAPGSTIPSAAVAIDGDRTRALREHQPPVIARVVDGRTLCDLRSVDPGDDAVVAAALSR